MAPVLRTASCLLLCLGVVIATGTRSCSSPAEPTVVLQGCWWDNGTVDCNGFPLGKEWTPGKAHLRLEVDDLASGSDSQYHCAYLQLFKREFGDGCREMLRFRNFLVGWVYLNSSCVHDKRKNCVVDLQILERVALLSQFTYRSSSYLFWDIKDLIHTIGSDSLVSEAFREFIAEKCDVPLANIYNLDNTSIEYIRVAHNLNNDSDVQLGFMPMLQVFQLHNCTIRKFPEDAHAQMPALEALQLSRCGLRAVPAALAHMQQLRDLDLSGSRLGRLSGQLPPLPRLQGLSLEDAGLHPRLEEDQSVFRAMPQLQGLILARNSLVSIGTALSGLTKLEFVDVSYNLLSEYPELQLTDNSIAGFTSNRFQTLPRCSRLCASGARVDLEVDVNNISTWDNNTDILGCVRRLNVANNSFRELSDEMLSALDRLEHLKLTPNSLHCEGCALRRFQQWLLRTPVQIDDARAQGAAARLTCTSPPALAGLPVGAAPSAPDACRGQVVAAAAAGSRGFVLGLSLGLAGGAALLLAVASCYRWRFELAYSLHLLRLRVQARRSRRAGGADASAQFLFDAFILYSGNDRSWVSGTLVPLLESGPQQYRICMHERDFQLGTIIVQNISHSMDRSRHTVIVMSKSFFSSKWCLWELDLANHRTLDPSQRDFIILLELEPVEREALPRHLRFLMETRTYLEWHATDSPDQDQQALRRLKRALGPSLFSQSQTTLC